MSGRAGLGLAQGFMQGYDFADRAESRDKREARAQERLGLATERQGWARDNHDRQQQEYQNVDDRRLVAAMQEGAKTGRFDPEIVGQFESRFGVDMNRYLDPQFGQSLDTLESTVKGQRKLRDPEVTNAFDDVFGPEVRKNMGEQNGDRTIKGKRVAGIYPVKGGRLAVDLDVVESGPDGRATRRNAPVTVNRSAQDDEVKTIPVDQAIDKLTGHRLMYNAVQKSPELQQMLRQRMIRLGGEVPERQRSKQSLVAEELAPYMGADQARQFAYGLESDGSDEDRLFNEMTQKGVPRAAALKAAYGVDQQGGRWGDPYKHDELGWVQRSPEGELKTIDAPESAADKPLEINGQLIDPETFEVMGDYRNPDDQGLAGGGKSLESADRSLIERIGKRYHGTFNPDGNFLGFDENARKDYAMGMQRVEELAQTGMPILKASRIGFASTRKPITEREAEKQAVREASKQGLEDSFIGENAKYEDFIERRTQELVSESRNAEQLYQQALQGASQNRGGLQTQGMQSRPVDDTTPPAGLANQSARQAPRSMPSQPNQSQSPSQGLPSRPDPRPEPQPPAPDNREPVKLPEGGIVEPSSFSRGQSSYAGGEAVQNLEAIIKRGERPNRQQIEAAARFYIKHPDAITRGGGNLIERLAIEEGL